MREVLHDEEGLEVAVVLENDGAVVELQSSNEGPDLSVDDEVIVVVDGRGRSVDVEGPNRARATIVEQLEEDPDELTLMVRVHEFFQGWDLFAEPEEDE